jgi:sugar O-acyltransferase (sialic acid O-acetyltransferase NeuD family)
MRYVVIGAAGHGQEVAWSLCEAERAQGRTATIAFLDDARPRGAVASGLGDVLGGLELAAELGALPGVAFVLGVGLPRTKAKIVAQLGRLGLRWHTVVHPRATIGPNVQLGGGSYVAAGAILTVNVEVGAFATVNMHCQVAHDGTVGAFATLHPDAHVAGGVTIGEGAELGSGSVVTPGVTIGPWAVLGAGCVAVRPLAGGATYVGVPARALRRAPAPVSAAAR